MFAGWTVGKEKRSRREEQITWEKREIEQFPFPAVVLYLRGRRHKRSQTRVNPSDLSVFWVGVGVGVLDKQQSSSAGFKLGQLGLSVSRDLFSMLWAIKRRLTLTVVPIFSFTVYQVVWRFTVPPRSSLPPFAVEAGSNSGSLGALHHCSQVACTLSLLNSILCLLDPNL